MAPPISILEFLDRNVSVDGRGAELSVSEHDLDKADVAAILQEVGGECVPEQVATARFPDAGDVDSPVDQLAEHVDRRPFAFGRQEEGRFREGAGEAWSDLDEILSYPFERPGANWNDSILSARPFLYPE
jgi:hypothetical protein